LKGGENGGFSVCLSIVGGRHDIFLDRTLTKDVWNTFASPFAIPAHWAT
jgi:hypothetical protein